MPSVSELFVHGQVRDLGMRRTTMELPDGSAVAFYAETVKQTWCGHCKTWVQTDGVLGPLEFMAKHRDGDCVR